jgi:hypothetical protein
MYATEMENYYLPRNGPASPEDRDDYTAAYTWEAVQKRGGHVDPEIVDALGMRRRWTREKRYRRRREKEIAAGYSSM